MAIAAPVTQAISDALEFRPRWLIDVLTPVLTYFSSSSEIFLGVVLLLVYLIRFIPAQIAGDGAIHGRPYSLG
jgi:hypothetical protein